FLGIVAIPMLRTAGTESPYRVLTSETSPAAADELRVKLRFQSAPSAGAVEQLVKSGLTQQKLAARYHIERRPNGEYVVIFEKKPEFTALSRLLDTWRSSPGVADVAIDGG